MTDRIQEGDLYCVITIDDVQFDIRYGFNCENERRFCEPSPIYPDFIKNSAYTKEGIPFATVYQDVCKNYYPKQQESGELWCMDCTHFEKKDKYIGLCRCEKNRRKAE